MSEDHDRFSVILIVLRVRMEIKKNVLDINHIRNMLDIFLLAN